MGVSNNHGLHDIQGFKSQGRFLGTELVSKISRTSSFYRPPLALGVSGLILTLVLTLAPFAHIAHATDLGSNLMGGNKTTKASAAEAAPQPSVTQLDQDVPAALLNAGNPTLQEAPTLADSLAAQNDNGNNIDSNVPPIGGAQLPTKSPKQAAEDALDERKEAFDGAVNGLMPLKPAEIRRLLELYDTTSQAVETPIYPDPEPESAFVQVSLDPGSKPIVIKTAVGNVTTLSIVDMTGQPWPIQDMTWAGEFQVEQPDSGSNMVRITPQKHFAQGNISMRLVGLNPPVIFTLKTERKTVHVRLDAQIPELGPNGVLPPMLTPVTIKAGDEDLSKVLAGIPSAAGMNKMKIDGVDGRTAAYEKSGQTYVRTPYTMLSPAWSKSVKSADGMNVYVIPSTPVVLLSDKGKMLRAYLTPMEQNDGE